MQKAEKVLLDKISEFLNNYEEVNNCIFMVTIDIGYKDHNTAYAFDGAHFTPIESEFDIAIGVK